MNALGPKYEVQYGLKNNDKRCKTCGGLKNPKWYHSERLVNICHCCKNKKRVSELEELTLSKLVDEDVMLIVDTSEKVTMKIKLGVLKEYLKQ